MLDALHVGLQSPDPPDTVTVHLLEGQTPAGSVVAAGPVSSDLANVIKARERYKNEPRPSSVLMQQSGTMEGAG